MEKSSPVRSDAYFPEWIPALKCNNRSKPLLRKVRNGTKIVLYVASLTRKNNKLVISFLI